MRSDSPVFLRPANDEDLPQLANWNRELISEEGSRNPMTETELLGRMRSWLETDWDVRIIEADGKPAGYLVGRNRPDEYVPETLEYYLRQFYILPAFRRMGIGRSAIEQIREELFPKVSAIVLDVLERNVPGRSFWGALGFEPQYTTMKLTRESACQSMPKP